MRFAVAFAIGAALALGACTTQPVPALPPGGTAIYVPPPPPPPPPPVIMPAPQDYAQYPAGTKVYHRTAGGHLYRGTKKCPAGMYWQGTRRVLVEGTNQTRVMRGQGRCVRK